MNTLQSTQSIDPPPSPLHMTRAMADAVQGFRDVQSILVEQSESVEQRTLQIDEDLERIDVDRDELAGLRREVETKLTDLAASTESSQREKSEIESKALEIAGEHKRLTTRSAEIEAREQQLSAQRLTDEVTARSLAESKESIARERKQCREELQQLAPQREEIQKQSAALAQRTEQLDSHAAELEETRSTLETLQHQIAHDQREVASQRETLLSKIGSTGNTASESKAEPDGTRLRPGEKSTHGSQLQAPKPGAGNAAAQFRKLRRDAKRKAIGI